MHNEIGSYDAKTKLPEILRRVEAGESFTITNRGKPIADLVPSRAGNEQRVNKAIAGILSSLTDKVKTDEEMAEMKNQGRK